MQLVVYVDDCQEKRIKLFVYVYDCQEKRIFTEALVISAPVPSELPSSGMLRRGTAVVVPKLAKVFSIVIRERILVTRCSNPQVHQLSIEHRVGRG